jgi:predicted enzyme related to lactoylglutathione lyase
MPTIGRVLETSLYVDRLDRAVEFYERIFGFPKLLSDDRVVGQIHPKHFVLQSRTMANQGIRQTESHACPS